MSICVYTFSLDRAVYATLCYFDYFSFPLTVIELKKYLLFYQGDVSLNTLASTLESSPFLESRIETKHGFYFLREKDSFVEMRRQRFGLAERKYAIAKKVTRIFACIPFVRMVAIVNSLAFNNTRIDGDIDFLIVVKKEWVAFARLICTGIMQICGLRPTAQNSRNAICLSFFLSDHALDLSSIRLPEREGVPDLYLRSWLQTFVPLYDPWQIGSRIHAENTWTASRDISHPDTYHARRNVRIPIVVANTLRVIEYILVRVMPFLDSYAFRFQEYILPAALRIQTRSAGTAVVFTRTMMKLHPDDRREKIREAVCAHLEVCNSAIQ